MARAYAKLSTSVWTDEDHRSLSMAAQWLYSHLLAHPRMPLCGVMDVTIARWARQAPDATQDVVEAALLELLQVGHVVVDPDTDEVMFRTFMRHDFSPGRWNKNLTAGFWRAWSGVESATLRKEVVRRMPDWLWEKAADSANGDAVSFRRSCRLEPEWTPRFGPQASVPSQPPFALRPSPVPPLPYPSRSSESQSDSRPSGQDLLDRAAAEAGIDLDRFRNRSAG